MMAAQRYMRFALGIMTRYLDIEEAVPSPAQMVYLETAPPQPVQEEPRYSTILYDIQNIHRSLTENHIYQLNLRLNITAQLLSKAVREASGTVIRQIRMLEKHTAIPPVPPRIATARHLPSPGGNAWVGVPPQYGPEANRRGQHHINLANIAAICAAQERHAAAYHTQNPLAYTLHCRYLADVNSVPILARHIDQGYQPAMEAPQILYRTQAPGTAQQPPMGAPQLLYPPQAPGMTQQGESPGSALQARRGTARGTPQLPVPAAPTRREHPEPERARPAPPVVRASRPGQAAPIHQPALLKEVLLGWRAMATAASPAPLHPAHSAGTGAPLSVSVGQTAPPRLPESPSAFSTPIMPDMHRDTQQEEPSPNRQREASLWRYLRLEHRIPSMGTIEFPQQPNAVVYPLPPGRLPMGSGGQAGAYPQPQPQPTPVGRESAAGWPGKTGQPPITQHRPASIPPVSPEAPVADSPARHGAGRGAVYTASGARPAVFHRRTGALLQPHGPLGPQSHMEQLQNRFWLPKHQPSAPSAPGAAAFPLALRPAGNQRGREGTEPPRAAGRAHSLQVATPFPGQPGGYNDPARVLAQALPPAGQMTAAAARRLPFSAVPRAAVAVGAKGGSPYPGPIQPRPAGLSNHANKQAPLAGSDQRSPVTGSGAAAARGPSYSGSHVSSDLVHRREAGERGAQGEHQQPTTSDIEFHTKQQVQTQKEARTQVTRMAGTTKHIQIPGPAQMGELRQQLESPEFINRMADQVYRDLERRLRTERMRKGLL